MKINMIQSVLIANRGEIAMRIIQTCKKMGIRSVAIYAEPDANAPFVQAADVAVAIGGLQAAESYLVVDKIIAAAKRTQVDAIHPGYGFLSENADFASRCAAENIIFIGPSAKAISLMGLKNTAKTLMAKNGVPVIPGYQGSDQSVARLTSEAELIGYPILLKAAAGGGGKGMRIVLQAADIAAAIAGAKRESKASFGDDSLLVERYFSSARHIEFQIFGDKHGNALHLFERECSIQRRYQKIIEESPSPVMTAELREKMGTAAVQAAKAIAYDNAGTVEFIVSGNDFYFLEVNTRLQVEHPVTEAITGLDLVEWQINIAEGQVLPLSQETLKSTGYALECRLYAEDPNNNFLPATGEVLCWQTPTLAGLRYDTGITSGSVISQFFDPMLAKVIAHAPNRLQAIRKMQYALRHLVCLGTTTNQAFLIKLLQQSEFIAGNYDTHYVQQVQQNTSTPNYSTEQQNIAAIACLLVRWQQRQEVQSVLRQIPSGWRNNFYQPQTETYQMGELALPLQYTVNNTNCFLVQVNDKSYEVVYLSLSANMLQMKVDGLHYGCTVVSKGDRYFVHHPSFVSIALTLVAKYPRVVQAQEKGSYTAPMPAQVVKVLVQQGESVSEGQALLVLSAMKMETTIEANESGKIASLFVDEGDLVEAGEELLLVV